MSTPYQLLSLLQNNNDIKNYYTIKGTTDNQLFLARKAIKAYESIITEFISQYDAELALQILTLVKSNINK